MPFWAILGLVGVGGYLLLSKSASASTTASAQAAANQTYAQQLAANPSGLAPGYQGQATGPYTPAPTPAPYIPPPTDTSGGGGQVYDPNLGGTPDINSLLSGMQPGYQGEPGTTTASGMVGQQHRRR